ncbi:hypothetical protein RI054_08g41220 [Pseudoscourfieldia marina]
MPALLLTGRSSALSPGLSSAAPRRLPASMIKHKAVKLMTHRRPKKTNPSDRRRGGTKEYPDLKKALENAPPVLTVVEK